jgi:probable DNA metabolism protein
MTVFFYNRTFEGLLTAVFDAYQRKSFPDRLLRTGDTPPLFTDQSHTVVAQEACALRVWTALQRKLPVQACQMLVHVWLSELEGSDELLFRYIRKTFDSPQSLALNFGDADVLEVQKIARKVSHEALYIKQFLRFQKAADHLFFAPVRPAYNALPLTTDHFADRFADQPWVIYDLRRKYGYHYDLHVVREITLDAGNGLLLDGRLDESLMAADEKLFQTLWRSYFQALTIQERIHPRLQRQHMPVRFWKDLTEKQ